MASLNPSAESSREVDAGRGIWRAALMVAAAALACYANTFSAPFIFDDIPSIEKNPTIQSLRASVDLIAPPALGGAGVAGRPVVNLSLAFNHALSGDHVWSYHLFNLLVHIGAGLALLGILRRTFLSAPLAGSHGRVALPLASAAALLWVVHPLQTESVTCVIQRTESMLGLFCLLTLYCFIRSTEPAAWRGWAALAWLACLLGAATKEVMAAAPVIVLLYDRTFVAGGFREAWRRRGRLHLVLASSWLLTGLLVWRSESRGGTVGFGHGVAWWEYALTQCRAIGLYLRLSFWPHPLVLDYGTPVVRNPLDVLPQAALIAALLAATVVALRRWPVPGFAGAWFFAILAPSSSVIPLVTQTIAEHRMYLPLAAVAGLAVTGLHAVAGRRSWAAVVALAVACAVVTARRNADYRTVGSIWEDTAAKVPANERAHYALALIAESAGRMDEAIAQHELALRLKPDDSVSHFNLAFCLARSGRLEEAVEHYRTAARLRPSAVDAHINLGAVFVRLERMDEAIAEFETVVRLRPGSGEDQFNLAQVYAEVGRVAEALPHFEAGARLKPDFAEGHYRLGNAYVKLNRLEEAVAAYRETVRLEPRHFEAWANLGGVLLALGRAAEAGPVLDEALRLAPDDPALRVNLARAREEARAGMRRP